MSGLVCQSGVLAGYGHVSSARLTESLELGRRAPPSPLSPSAQEPGGLICFVQSLSLPKRETVVSTGSSASFPPCVQLPAVITQTKASHSGRRMDGPSLSGAAGLPGASL